MPSAYVTEIPQGHRDCKWISSGHETGNLKSLGASLGQCQQAMSTAAIEVRCNARPTRLAFVVPRPDRYLLLSVIARAMSLWAAFSIPIVILDGSTREVRGLQEQIISPAR